MLTIDSKTIRSPNFDNRPLDTIISHVVIHYTEIPFEEAVEKFSHEANKVSCHYIIRDNGDIYSIINDSKRAWHAGNSYWQGKDKVNDFSIGIELDNSGKEPFSEQLIYSLINLCRFLERKHNIKPENFIGHSDIAPDRKIDPGIFFPWAKLFEHGFGIWPSNLSYINKPKTLLNFSDHGNEVINLQSKLSKIGYNIIVSGVYDKQTSNVVRAFISRFCPEILLAQGGLEYYFNLENIYNWNSKCEEILEKLVSFLSKIR